MCKRAHMAAVIEVRKLEHTYRGSSAPAVRDLDFDVNEGEVFGLLGPSGAGKSTTVNILTGLLQGWRGSIDVMGRPLPKWGNELYRRIGVSFELPNHYLKLSALENLEYFRALYGAETEAAQTVLDWVGLGDHGAQRVEAFSKGMKNRLNFARSLLNRPKLWFLDEPTAGLDPVNAVRIRELIAGRRSQGVTTVITTHDMHTAQELCDRVAFIVDGQIATIDSPTALRATYGRRELVLATEEQEHRFSLDGLADNAEFLTALRQPIKSLHSQEATLEQVFVEVTGRTLQ